MNSVQIKCWVSHRMFSDHLVMWRCLVISLLAVWSYIWMLSSWKMLFSLTFLNKMKRTDVAFPRGVFTHEFQFNILGIPRAEGTVTHVQLWFYQANIPKLLCFLVCKAINLLRGANFPSNKEENIHITLTFIFSVTL